MRNLILCNRQIREYQIRNRFNGETSWQITAKLTGLNGLQFDESFAKELKLK